MVKWGIILKETNKLIGICCLGDFDEGSRRSVVDFGFNTMNLNRIEATITPGNDASVRVLEKLDFIQKGIVRQRDLIKGKLEDGIIM